MFTKKAVHNKGFNQFAHLVQESNHDDSDDNKEDVPEPKKEVDEGGNAEDTNLFKNYYVEKKNTFAAKKFMHYKNQNNYRENHGRAGMAEEEREEFQTVGPRKKDRATHELKILDLPDNFLDLNMLNYYRVLAHHNEDKNWDLNSYLNICTLTNWRDVTKLFNTMNLDCGPNKITDFDIFIMKNDISPLWEDEENRHGSICSIKIDSLVDGYDMLKYLFYHVCNNTLMHFNHQFWNNINGVSFSPKKMDSINTKDNFDELYCVIIKIWYKTNYTQMGSIEKYFNDDVSALIKKYSIKVKAIKPEY